MKKNYLQFLILTFLFSACQTTNRVSTALQNVKLSPVPPFSSTKVAITTTPVSLLSETIESQKATSPASHTPTNPTPSTPLYNIKPVINNIQGKIYETLFSIPVGGNSIINYQSDPDSINGPNAIAILPDESFMIYDSVANRLLNFDQMGGLLKTIELANLGIKNIIDIRVKSNELFLLQTFYKEYRVYQLSLDGSLIKTEEIPYQFPIGKKNLTLENSLSGLAIDCEGSIILEIMGGSNLFPLSDVQQMQDPSNITEGYLCNGKRYFVTTAGPFDIPKISAGDITYQTNLTYKSGGLRFLDVFPDGSFYLIRDDLINLQVIKVDKSLFYVGADGAVEGVARAPISESFYPVMRDMAIGPTGEVYFLLPRPYSLDIVRLNFYKEIDPLTSEAVPPNLSEVNEIP